MIINLFSRNTETSSPETLFMFNQVVAWALRRAFTKIGVETRFVSDDQFWDGDIPEADHSIVISNFVMRAIRNDPALHQKMREATKGKMTLYLDSDYAYWWRLFDHVFTIVEPLRSEVQYVYAGWGADPSIFYPDQEDKAIFINSLLYGKWNGKFDYIYDDVRDIFHISEEQLNGKKPVMHKTTIDGMEITVYLPVPVFRENVVPWSDFRCIQRKCHFYFCTQLGESVLTRIESATCGSLLVVPKPLLRSRTMGSMEHAIYETRQELIEILKTKTDVKAIREKALENSWDKVVGRMLLCLESQT